MSLASVIARRARELGLDAVGFARAGPLDEDAARLARWLAAGRHGGLGYMERWAPVRRDPAHPGMVEGARTVMSVGLSYNHEARAAGLAPLLARYARGPDYHEVLGRALRALLAELRSLEPTLRGRAVVDTAPLLERAWAARAGLGWIGRNGCLIHPRLGSWVVLGELVLTAELEPDLPVEDRCGDCRACLEACPVSALSGPDGRDLDARRCLSYWTVEAREPLPAELEAHLVLFGCDRCQEVCPHNLAAERPAGSGLAPLDRWATVTLEDLAAASAAAVRDLAEGTPLARADPELLVARARRLLGR